MEQGTASEEKTYRAEFSRSDGGWTTGNPGMPVEITFDAADDRAAVTHVRRHLAEDEERGHMDGTLSLKRLVEVIVKPVYRDVRADQEALYG